MRFCGLLLVHCTFAVFCEITNFLVFRDIYAVLMKFAESAAKSKSAQQKGHEDGGSDESQWSNVTTKHLPNGKRGFSIMFAAIVENSVILSLVCFLDGRLVDFVLAEYSQKLR